MSNVIHIPWYATGFRSDAFAEALAKIAPVALRYGATSYAVYRSRDDQYKLQQAATFPEKLGFDRYWYGEEFSRFRAEYSSWYQVPVLYYWNDVVAAGALDPAALQSSAG